jgi:inner membrane protein
MVSGTDLTGHNSLPYKVTSVDAAGKPVETTQHILIIPDNLHVTGQIDHEIRVRSIYKVLLYRASLVNKGDIVLQIPKELSQNLIQWQDARICFGISDFKGIEERLIIRFNGVDNELSPGLPASEVDEKGLSAPVCFVICGYRKALTFSRTKPKGEMLHLFPSGNSVCHPLHRPNPALMTAIRRKERLVGCRNGYSAKQTSLWYCTERFQI